MACLMTCLMVPVQRGRQRQGGHQLAPQQMTLRDLNAGAPPLPAQPGLGCMQGVTRACA